MTDEKETGAEKLQALNQTLIGVENELMARAIDRRDNDIDHCLDFINKAADDDAIDIKRGEGEAEEEGEVAPDDGEGSGDADS